VRSADPEAELVDVLVAGCELLEHPAHAQTATMTRTTVEIRTSWDGISQGRVAERM